MKPNWKKTFKKGRYKVPGINTGTTGYCSSKGNTRGLLKKEDARLVEEHYETKTWGS